METSLDHPTITDAVERPLITAVSPIYRGKNTLGELVFRLQNSLSSVSSAYEIVLVDDGSPDDSWSGIQSLCQADFRIKGIRLSRNFGQHYAITAGLNHATGSWVTVLDCDLQDLPEEIPNLYRKAVEDNLDIVLARRRVRQDGIARKVSSKAFYRLFGYLTDTRQDPTVGNFGIYHEKVVSAIRAMGDAVRYLPTMSQWVGFSRGFLDVEHAARTEGKSTYSYSKLFSLAGHNIVAFSNKPLRLTVLLGSIMSGASFVVAAYYLYLYLVGEIVVLGYTSLILSIWFIGGMIIALLGIVGIYVGYTFEKVKGRPSYIIDERLNFTGADHQSTRRS